MDAILTSFETVLPLFLIIITGWAFSRAGAASIHWVEILNRYALWIGFPALVIFSLMQIEEQIQDYLPLILLNSAYLIASMGLVFILAPLFSLKPKMKQSLFLILPFGNIAYLGIPVFENTFGQEILPVAALLAAVYAFWMLTLALVLVEVNGNHSVNLKKMTIGLLKNPLLISVFIGIAIVVFDIPVPKAAKQTIQLFSQSVTAVVLFSLGIFIGLQRIGNPHEWLQVALISTTAMIILPALLYLILRFTSLPPEELKATVIDAAMPLGLTPYALSVQYQLETKLFARIVVFGTLISIMVIPLWIFILG
jgi:predicted permease